MSERDAFDIFSLIFKVDPLPANYYNLRLDADDPGNSNIDFNDILLEVFFHGIKVLFGETVNLQNLNKVQYDLINKYMQSLGHEVVLKYDYENNIPVNINVWFEKLK